MKNTKTTNICITNDGQLVRVTGCIGELAKRIVKRRLRLKTSPAGATIVYHSEPAHIRDNSLQSAHTSEAFEELPSEPYEPDEIVYHRGSQKRIVQVAEELGIEVDDQTFSVPTLPPDGPDQCGVRKFIRRRSHGIIDVLRGTSIGGIVCEAIVGDVREYFRRKDAEPGENHRTRTFGRTIVVARDASEVDQLHEHIEAAGIQVSKISEDDEWQKWLLPPSGPISNLDFRSLVRHPAWTVDSFEQGSDRHPEVVIGTWNTISALLHDFAVPIRAVFTTDCSAVHRENVQRLLQKIPPHTRLVGVVRRFNDLPQSDRDALTECFGSDRLQIATVKARFCPPTIEFLSPKLNNLRLTKIPKRLPKDDLAGRVVEAVVNDKERNKCVATIARYLAGETLEPKKVNFRIEPEDSGARVLVVAANERHVALLLAHLPDGWFGGVNEGFDLPVSLASIEDRLIRPELEDDDDVEDDTPRLVTSTSRIQLAGRRDLILRCDAGFDLLDFSPDQLVKNQSDRFRLIDFADYWHKEVMRLAAMRCVRYQTAGWQVETRLAPRFDGDLQNVVAPSKPAASLLSQNAAYATIERGETASRKLQKSNTGLLLNDVANRDVLRQMLVTLRDPMKHGQAAGSDGLRPGDVGVVEEAQLIKEIHIALSDGTWFPDPDRIAQIPKPGQTAKRAIRIPTLDSRIVQMALLDAVGKHFCPKAQQPRLVKNDQDNNSSEVASGVSWATRGNGVQRMLADIKLRYEDVEDDYGVFVVLDIKRAFDSVSIETVMKACGTGGANLFSQASHKAAASVQSNLLEESPLKSHPPSWRAEQSQVRALIRTVLGGAEKRKIGIAQGGPLSPLALDLLLDSALDYHVTRRKTPRIWYWRYVDDIVLLVPNVETGRKVVQEVKGLLKPLHLELREENEEDVIFEVKPGTSVPILGLKTSHTESCLQYEVPVVKPAAIVKIASDLMKENDGLSLARSYLRSTLHAFAPACDDETFLTSLKSELTAALPSVSDSWLDDIAIQACQQWTELLS